MSADRIYETFRFFMYEVGCRIVAAVVWLTWLLMFFGAIPSTTEERVVAWTFACANWLTADVAELKRMRREPKETK